RVKSSKVAIHAAVEDQAAGGGQNRRVIRYARLPTPQSLAGLDRDRVDTANLVLAGSEPVGVLRVVDELRSRFAISARHCIETEVLQLEIHNVVFRIVSAAGPVSPAHVGGTHAIGLTDLLEYDTLIHNNETLAVDLLDEVLLIRCLRPEEFAICGV